MMITEIGALAGIIKTLLDATKVGRELFGGGPKKETVESLKKTQQRLAGIADQLYQSVALSKMLPLWLREQESIDLYANKLTDAQVKLLDSKLRGLIRDSIHDHFSGTFFRTNFTVLPKVEAGIEKFRERLLALEKQLDGILPGDASAWKQTWPILKVRLHDLRGEATDLENLADDVHAALVKELRDAASVV